MPNDNNLQSFLVLLARAALAKADKAGRGHVTLASIAKKATKANGPFELFGSVSSADVAGALRASGFDVSGNNVYVQKGE